MIIWVGQAVIAFLSTACDAPSMGSQRVNYEHMGESGVQLRPSVLAYEAEQWRTSGDKYCGPNMASPIMLSPSLWNYDPKVTTNLRRHSIKEV